MSDGMMHKTLINPEGCTGKHSGLVA